jgi:hypothetical protein
LPRRPIKPAGSKTGTFANTIRKAGSSKNQKRHACGFEYINFEANSSQFSVKHRANVSSEPYNEFITTSNGKASWSTKAFVHTVCKIEHHNVARCGSFQKEFPDNHICVWTMQGIITVGETTEASMAEVIAEFHSQKQQPMSCRFPTCLQLWQDTSATTLVSV